jgi:gamma-glutamylcyclotransferase (GGCT)/AIG2-like uncharacterized protein YtfP
MAAKSSLIFVYGTLCKNESNHHLLENADSITDQAWTFGELYDTCLGYPALIEGFNNKVYGELYKVNDEILANLDGLTEYCEHDLPVAQEYQRMEQEIYTDQGIYLAYVYIYNRSISEAMRRIPNGDWKNKTSSLDYCLTDVNKEKEQESYKEYFEKEYDELIDRRRFMIKFLIVTSAIFLMFTILSPWYRVFQLPSIDLLTRSKELEKDANIREWMQTVVSITTHNSKATGFNIHSDGMIITNYHVVDNTEAIFVTLQNGSIFKGEVIAKYPDLDLAIIDIDGKNMPKTELSSVLDVGTDERLIIIGNPLGLTQVVKEGQVIGLINITDWDLPVLAIESPILQGSSGSPVFNEKGKVIAVIFANAGTMMQGDDEVIIGLCVPIDYLLEQDFFVSASNTDNYDSNSIDSNFNDK